MTRVYESEVSSSESIPPGGAILFRATACAATCGGSDDRALRERDASLERLLRGGIRFRGLRVALRASVARGRASDIVPIRMKIVRRGGEPP